ncbi:NYN domain-containing protein [Sphingomonas oligophenolica]|nr:NYN domain-containing protein [Sphingomonas oligophenolica]
MRICVFVDYWNLQLTLNKRLGEVRKDDDFRAKIDWKGLGALFSQEAANVIAGVGTAHSYEGTYIYTSYNPKTDDGKKFKQWATTWLDRQPGINVQARERKPKALPKCNTCHREITHCPHTGCGHPIVQTVEKGVDTLLATDLIRLAVSNAYDVAVIATLDADMLPAVEFVQSGGKKIIQAGFPPMGVDLATECWGSFDVMKIAAQIQRP